MRYRDSGEVHMDFHRTLNGTIKYLRENYGIEFLDQTFRRTARSVYRSIWEDLQRGDPEQLVEHWQHYFEREGGEIEIERAGKEITMHVKKCPAIAYLKSWGIKPDPAFCRQTAVMNDAWSENTPFEIMTEVTGEGECTQTIRRCEK
ncbi:MAG: hypothetical protein ACLFWL_11455 [Candidatus Brocadiia bacterium]